MKKYILGIITGLIVASVIGVSATILYQADEVGFTPSNPNWNVNNLEDALNDLYTNRGSVVSKFCTFQTSEYGDANNHLSAGSKYSCDPGDGTPRNFYVLEVNSNKVDLIMEENIATGTMSWYNAMKYFVNDSNGISIKNSWTNILDIDLPKAQSIAKAVNNSSWKAAENNAWWCLETRVKDQPNGPKYCLTSTETETINTLWLWDYTRDCSEWGCKHSQNSSWAGGYWTRDAIVSTAYAWNVDSGGILTYYTVSSADGNGIRPVITVLKDNLQG